MVYLYTGHLDSIDQKIGHNFAAALDYTEYNHWLSLVLQLYIYHPSWDIHLDSELVDADNHLLHHSNQRFGPGF